MLNFLRSFRDVSTSLLLFVSFFFAHRSQPVMITIESEEALPAKRIPRQSPAMAMLRHFRTEATKRIHNYSSKLSFPYPLVYSTTGLCCNLIYNRDENLNFKTLSLFIGIFILKPSPGMSARWSQPQRMSSSRLSDREKLANRIEKCATQSLQEKEDNNRQKTEKKLFLSRTSKKVKKLQKEEKIIKKIL